MKLTDSILRILGKDDSWHINFLAEIAKVTKPKLYVEIGIYEAATINSVSKFSESSIGVDINPNAEKFLKSQNSKFIYGDSLKAAEHIRKISKTIDLCFIDGDHSSGAVISDFLNLKTFASDTAIFCFHDTWPNSESDTADNRCSDSYRVPNLLAELTNGDWSAITIPVYPGLTIAQKRLIKPEWMNK
jgi:predicted O-methyltransferase YrrM